MESSDLKDISAHMDKSVEAIRNEFATVRTGKASPALLDLIKVDAYGQQMPLNQMATIGAPEPRLIVVQPYDPSQLAAIEKAIMASDLGLVPNNDGKIIRIPIPPLTEERRKELVRLTHKIAEEGRVAIRNIRHDANKRVHQQQKDGSVSEDDMHRLLKEVQDLTDKHIASIDQMLERKEQEVMEV
ncbi:MAG TPA: ribosome recycling factor [Gemmatimonadota bacterium]|nr:ribosome recycling factor [Gemmatimonadota bacterium]